MNEETSLIAFKAINNFINDLSSAFVAKHRPLKLYQRLINRTQISHDRAITKHIKACKDFCIANRDAISGQDSKKLTEPKISYSQRVYVDMAEIFKLADKDTSAIIWQHILTISAIVDPAGNAKEILRQNVEDGKSGVTESNFLTDIISKVENNVDADANPMEAVSSIMQSGVFTELLSGMQGDLSSGKLDISKLLGAVQGMVSSLGDQVGDDPQSQQAMGLLSNMTNMMGNMAGPGGTANGAPPDMSGMMQAMTSMMGGMAHQPNIQDVSENKEEEHRESTD